VSEDSEEPLPEGWTTRACARCGRSFACGANADSCWCDGVVLSDGQRAALSALSITGCLCRECLEAVGSEPA
jgi:hypothetical protein